jgi:phosphatidylinositol-3-phosphatase
MARQKASRLASILSLLALMAAACGTPTPPPTRTPIASASAGSTAAVSSPSPSPTLSGGPILSPSPTDTPGYLPGLSPNPTRPPTAAVGIPAFRHIYLIIMENKEYGSIVGSRAAPYENALIARYGLATNDYAVSHPSEPNYVALTSGGLNGVASDGYYNLRVANLFDQISRVGRAWHVYAQDYPGNCYTGSVAGGGVDGFGYAGEYARKHNPAISYSSIEANKAQCANITRLAGFNPAAAAFEMIIPNLINDMHSSSVAAGDVFLRLFVPKILDSPAFAHSVLFITWDEGATGRYGGGHIATIVVSPGMRPASRYTGLASHYSLLRTIEAAWHMPFLGHAAAARPLAFPY